MLIRSLVSFLILCCLPLTAVAAAEDGVIEGRVTTPDGDAATDVRVVIVELNLSVYVDDQGRYTFEGIPFGSYHLQAISSRFGSTVSEVTLSAASLSEDLMLGQSRHRERVVVTATRSGRGSAEVIQPVNVLDSTDLVTTMQPSLGETLAREPGIRSSSFGAGSSRPIIRGQSAGRVRVLEGGLDTGDASTTSPDHAVSVEPMAAERIEVLRGPSTLLYGGEAVGGVVNVIDQRIPEYRAARPLTGTLNLAISSATGEESASLNAGGGVGSFAWHADAFSRETDDYDIPGFAVLGDPMSDSGTLGNSSVESEGGSVGFSWVGKNGFLGAAVKRFDTNYGIPAELEEDSGMMPPPLMEEEGIRIDLEQDRYEVRGGFDFRDSVVTGVRVDVGVTDYVHRELEGADVGTTFFTDAYDARVELTYGGSKWMGVAGGQLSNREVEAIGAEAFLPPNETDRQAVFVVQEFDQDGPLRWEFGLRAENSEITTPVTAPAEPLCPTPTNRDIDTFSGAAGMAWVGEGGVTVGVSLTSGSRAPNAEELFSCGEHVATLSFEVGEPTLEEETALGLDVSVRKRNGRVSGEVNLFRYDYDDYIYEFDTGMTEPPMDPDGLPVFMFTQQNAEFSGVELNGLIHLKHSSSFDVDLEIVGDYVRAELDDGTPVPRIPPFSVGAGLLFNGSRWHGAARVRHYGEQDRIAAFETMTDSYTTVDANVGYRLASSGLVHDIVLRLDNLTDEEIRLHTSRLKDLVPQPGRNATLSYRLVF